jgi:hypothetical protein
MSAVCILTPVVIAAWPAFSAAVVAASASLGYAVVEEMNECLHNHTSAVTARKVELQISQSEIVTNQLGREQRISVSRDGVTVTFSRNARGQASLCVTGTGQSEAALRAIGEELSQRVVQQYVYQRLMEEMRARQYHVVEEEVAQGTIRLKVRHWEN